MQVGLDRTILASPPLVVTLAQVRFEERAELAEASVASALRAPMALHGLTSATQVHVQQIAIGVPGSEAETASSSKVAVGWQFKAPDDAVIVTVLRDQMSLEVKSYPGWEAFLAVWQSCLEGLLGVVKPELVTRLGLRYVNRVQPRGAADPTGWVRHGLIDEAFLGPATGSALSQYVNRAEGRVALTFEDGSEALLHHGVVPEPEGPVFTLDIDCFSTQADRFTVEVLSKRLADLNDHSLMVFQAVVKESLRAEMTSARGERS